MLDLDNLSEEQIDDLSEKVVDLFSSISEEALILNNPDAYSRVRKIANDEDYIMECRFRYLSYDDDFFYADSEKDDYIVVEIWYTGAEKELKNDVHVVDIAFSASGGKSEEVSASWFPDE